MIGAPFNQKTKCYRFRAFIMGNFLQLPSSPIHLRPSNQQHIGLSVQVITH